MNKLFLFFLFPTLIHFAMSCTGQDKENKKNLFALVVMQSNADGASLPFSYKKYSPKKKTFQIIQSDLQKVENSNED